MIVTVPKELKYTKEHEWVLPAGNNRVRVGLTDFAQRQLGDVVYVELPKVGDTFAAEDEIGTVESVKAVAEVFAPVAGKVVTINEGIVEDPELVNQEPYGDGWFIELEVSDAKQLSSLMDAATYENFLKDAE
ncbi:glycine cleavage system protein GcvH [Hyalangium rubrum]|uniref:Glycine cleavage system H protein n=1 Tax=Hyalangium rubrum TaxID=3103134 RepID=A0ABU5H4V2_9BACT|nr:glycine cleavage system protein GcvH [Hyalangium sp. s54d21]MDY7228142.1 glycine cleavage system protein GcvH [Hyalangium sp. s54d21]